MIKVTVTKNLVGLEDLLTGVGTVSQQRGPSGNMVTITKINASNLPFDNENSLQDVIDALQIQIDNLPEVVDGDGNLLTGLINTSNLDLDLAGRIWRKTISGTVAEIYYGTELMFQYNPTDGNIVNTTLIDYIDDEIEDVLAYVDAEIDALGTAAFLDVGTTANKVVQLNGDAKLPAVDGSLLINLNVSGVPVGVIVAVPYSTPDSGYLECDGQLINRTTYAALFAKIGETFGAGDGSTTFAVPDLRGEFIRGWDNTKGTDTGRALGSFQTNTIQAHTHDGSTLVTNNTGSHAHSVSTINQGESTNHSAGTIPTGHVSTTSGGTANGSAIGSAGSHAHSILGNTGSTGSAETRPRNIALMYQIKV